MRRLCACTALLALACATTPDAARMPLVIAHRGASGERPEHTLAAYALAIEQGADFIEVDLVPTRDGHLIARHENELSLTTDVETHAAFADRRSTRTIDGRSVSGWFSEDFSLDEIRVLRARERIPEVRPGNRAFDGLHPVPTLADIVGLVQRVERTGGPRVGLYLEIKHATYFAHEGRRADGRLIGFSTGREIVRVLSERRFVDPERVYIQAFEIEPLVELHRVVLPAQGLELPLTQLTGDATRTTGSFSQPWDVVFHARRGDDLRAIYGDLVDAAPGGLGAHTTYADLLSPGFLRAAARGYASALAPWKQALRPAAPISPAEQGGVVRYRRTGAVAPFVETAHALGLPIHTWTLRAEERFLALDAQGRPETMTEEMLRLLDLGVAGLITDHPRDAVAARARHLGLGQPSGVPPRGSDDAVGWPHGRSP